ncbi:MAG TPA: phosphate uptake regulator PhoU, partial [Nitrososphaera sp.]|nr:phosphate uptake regulator PhoU [Nitrososphaera sp.]
DVVIDPALCKDDFGQVLRRIISFYLKGYSRIDIVVAGGGRLTSTQRTVIKELVRRCLMGTEIISDSHEGISLQVLLGHAQLNVHDAIKRMYLITASMHNDAIRALSYQDHDLSDSVIRNDDDVDRFSFYVMRQLDIALRGEVDYSILGLNKDADLLRYLLVVNFVERIADLACKIASDATKIKEPLDDYVVARIRRLSESATGFVADAVMSLFEEDYDTAERVIRASRLFSAEVEKDFALIEKNESFIKPASCIARIVLILESIRRTAQQASEIAEVVLNVSVEKPQAQAAAVAAMAEKIAPAAR